MSHGGGRDVERASGVGFVSAPYVATAGGVLRPMGRVDRCPLGGDGVCRLTVQLYRPRKTGPGYPVQVLLCRTHGRSFTVYPPGHVPYGRIAVAPVDALGFPVGGQGGWEASLFRCWPGRGSRAGVGGRGDR